LCKKTGSEALWLYTRAIQALMPKKIKWQERWNNAPQLVAAAAILLLLVLEGTKKK
jgi:hypothetical protein